MSREDFMKKSESYSPLEANQIDAQSEKGNEDVVGAEWRQLAVILDRILFVIFMILSLLVVLVQ